MSGSFVYKLLIGIFVFLFLGLPIRSSTQAQGFSDEFDNPTLPGWEMTPGVSAGEGVLRIEPGNFIHRGGDWTDYSLAVRFRIAGEGAFVISFRSSGESSYHLLLDMQHFVFQREASGRVNELAAGDVVLKPDTWYELTIETKAGEVLATIQGVGTLGLQESDYLISGGVAMETLGNLAAEVDHISLLPLETEGTQSAGITTDVVTSAPGDLAYHSLPWVYTGGPLGGLGYDIRIDPNNPNFMYVTDAWAGAFKSIDGGQNWVPINQGLTARVGPSNDGIPVFSLTIDPNNSNTLWVGTQFGGGVFRSDDAGETWRSLSNGIQERALTIRGFTVEPGNSNVVYLGGEIPSWEWNGEPLPGLGLDMVKGAVYKTTDGGQNWNRIWYGDNLTRYIWIHPQDHDLIYVSTGIFDREAANSNPTTIEPGGVGILRSRDGGTSWETLGVENGIRDDELYFGSLAMHPRKPEILIGAAGNDPYMWALERPVGAIYRTQDGGESWTRVLDLPNASAVEICESDPQVVYAASLSGFYRSDDGGLTWALEGGSGDLGQTEGALWGPPDAAAGFPIDMQCDLSDPMRIFVNNYGGGNFLSENGGQTWVNASQGYTGALMHQVVVAPENPAKIYASARSGIFISENGGQTWSGMSTGVARALEAYAIALNPKDSSHLLAVVGDAGPVPKISYDSGQTWHEAEPFFDTTSFYDWGLMKKATFSPQLPERVVGIQAEVECGEFGNCEGGRGVIYSDDAGETWHQSSLREGMATDLVFAADGRAFVSVYPDRVYRSDDGGATWTLVAENIRQVLSPHNQDPDMPAPAVVSIAVDPRNPSKLYAGLTRSGVLISQDGGVNWVASSSGMNPETSVLDLVTDQANSNVIYAATPDSGVYVSSDGGVTWSAINAGLLTRAAVSLALSSDGSVLYVATTGGGVLRLGTP